MIQKRRRAAGYTASAYWTLKREVEYERKLRCVSRLTDGGVDGLLFRTSSTQLSSFSLSLSLSFSLRQTAALLSCVSSHNATYRGKVSELNT